MAKKNSTIVDDVKEALDHFERTVSKFKSGRHNEENAEVIDPRPMAVSVKYRRPPTLEEQMQSFVRSAELRRFAEAVGVETFDEANDFEMDDINDPLERFFSTPTPWEENTFGQFEEDANAIRKKVDDMVADAKKRKAEADELAKKAERQAIIDEARKKPKGGNPPAGDEDD